MKDDEAEYETTGATAFDLDWVDSIIDKYFMEVPKETYQSTLFSAMISSFIGKNWYEVKYHMVQLLSTLIWEAGIQLSYLIRGTSQYLGRYEWNSLYPR